MKATANRRPTGGVGVRMSETRSGFPEHRDTFLFVGPNQTSPCHGCSQGDHREGGDHFEAGQVHTADVDGDHLGFTLTTAVLAGELRLRVEVHGVVVVSPSPVLGGADKHADLLAGGVVLDLGLDGGQVDGEAFLFQLHGSRR